MPRRQHVIWALEPFCVSIPVGCQCILFFAVFSLQALTNQAPSRVAWLSDFLLKPILSETGGDASEAAAATLSKRYKFAKPVLIELGTRAPELSLSVLKALNVPALLASPYKQVRDEVSNLLFFILRNTLTYADAAAVTGRAGEAKVAPSSPREAVDAFFTKDCATRLNTEVKASLADGAESKGASGAAKEQERLLLETLLGLMTTSVNSGDAIYTREAQVALLPALLRTTHHSDTQTAALANFASNLVSWSPTLPRDVPAVLKAVESVLSNESWHVRQSAIKFLQIWLPRHVLLFSGAQEAAVQDLCVKGLLDNKLEVRLAASQALAGLLAATAAPPAAAEGEESSGSPFGTDARLPRLHKQFLKWAATKIPKLSGAPAGTAYADALRTRHAGVLGLSAFVSSHPYDLPAYLPPILAHLSHHVHDPTPIGGQVRQLFGDFMRTHQDAWHQFKERFSPDDLELVEGVVSSPSYFA